MAYKKIKVEYRKNYKIKHPVYLYAYDEKTKKYKYIGITHASITKGIKNIPIDNPNPKDKKQSYFRPKPSSDKEKVFSKYKYPWKTTRRNGQIARNIKKRDNSR